MEKELKNKIENLGWFITKMPDEWILSKYSPAGEDFCISVSNKNLVEDVKQAADNFDIDEHVEFYTPYRGTNGVPNSIKELVEDAEAIKDMLTELYEGIKSEE